MFFSIIKDFLLLGTQNCCLIYGSVAAVGIVSSPRVTIDSVLETQCVKELELKLCSVSEYSKSKGLFYLREFSLYLRKAL